MSDIGEWSGRTKAGVPVMVCMRLGICVSFIDRDRASRAQIVGGDRFADRFVANHNAAQPLAHVAKAGGEVRIAVISLAAMSKRVTRVTPSSSGPCPIVIWRGMRSLMLSTRRHLCCPGGCPAAQNGCVRPGVKSSESVLAIPSLRSRRSITGAMRRLPSLVTGRAGRKRLVVRRGLFMEHPGVNSGSEQIVVAAVIACMSPVRWRLNSPLGRLCYSRLTPPRL
jgi:hypothetical protein